MAHRINVEGLPGESNESRMRWLAAQIRASLYLGKLAPGDRLPSVRELARRLRISPTTALDLYRTLESNGLVQGRERSGMFVGRAASHHDASGSEEPAFRLVATVAKKLSLQGIAGADFSSMLLRYVGQHQRDDFKVAFVGYRESLELIDQQLKGRLGFRLPFVYVAPKRTPGELRVAVTSHPSIGCLMTALLSFPPVRELAEELGVPLVTLRLAPSAARIFETSSSGRHYVLVRDRDHAVSLRRTACNLARIRGDLPPCASDDEDGACRWCDMVQARQAPGVSFAALDEEVLLEDFDSAAETIHATATSLDAVRARYGGTKTVVPCPAELSEETVHELLFHYVCGPSRPAESSCAPSKKASPGVMTSRPAMSARTHADPRA